MEELIDSIFSDLKTELNSELTGENDQALLLVKVRNAVDDVECARNHQGHHTDEFKEKDLKKMKPIIKRLALYDWNTIGAEGHSSYSDSGISRTFVSRDDILSQVIPFATVLSAQ